MKPILYAETEEKFDSLGYGTLTECTSCYCEEERNGIFEVTFKYPTGGALYDYIKEGCYIKVKPNEKQKPQIFKIYGSSKVIKGEQEFYCEHISYRLNKVPIMGISIQSKTAKEAMDLLKSSSLVYNQFSFESDIDSQLSTAIVTPVSIRKALGGVDGSILDTWGGEFEWDNFVVYLKKMRGDIKEIPIKYGFNLQSLNKKRYIDEVYTTILPYVTYTNDNNQNITVTLGEKYLTYENIQPTELSIYVKDFSDMFADDETKNEETLRAKCKQWMQTNKLYLPTQNITVEVVKLEQTEQYKDLHLEKINLCDYIPIIYEDLNANSVLQVIKIKYDCLLERNDTIELGDTIITLNSQVQKMSLDTSSTIEKITQGYITAINDSIGLATGNKGGHIVLFPSSLPEELLVMDEDNVNNAINIIKSDKNGISHSNNGYKGSYKTLISIDGKIAGFSVDDNGIYTDTFRMNKSGDIKCYTWADLFIIGMVISSTIQENNELISRYDFDNDGQITQSDYDILKARLEAL